jgi:hypothetical protein|tara:strand:- start:517 stop:1125 length:609 start_codon:yes stop_codon:yes gene_type:complete
MKKRFIFSRILGDMLEQDIKPGSPAATEFFEARAKTMKKTNPAELIERVKKRKPTKPGGIGDMFIFQYDPKYKDQPKILPYYDRFPVIIMFDTGLSGFMGLNFHYLPYADRALFLERLRIFSDGTDYDDEYQLTDIDWSNIKHATGNVKYWRPCIKRYLNNNVKGRLIKVHPAEWDLVLLLPIERFVGARRPRVFKESQEKY